MKYHSKPKINIINDINLTIDPNRSLIIQAECINSPNYDLRPENTKINLLVIHGISLPPGEFLPRSEKYIKDLFSNQLDPNIHPYFKTIADLKVSCHCLIMRSGKLLQFVPFKYRAWHAGKSDFKGRENCNDFSIGIELEGSDDMPYTNIQYQVLKSVINAIQTVYPLIKSNRIVGHSDIAPNRKTDPGKYFNWDWIK